MKAYCKNCGIRYPISNDGYAVHTGKCAVCNNKVKIYKGE